MAEEENYFLSIPKTDIPLLPVQQYSGEIYVIDRPELVDDAVAELKKYKILGFDTETRPTFKKGQSNTTALIQLSAGNKCYLFRICKIGIPHPLAEILETPDIMKIGASVHDDFLGLSRIAHCSPQNFLDIQHYVKEFHIADNSLARIYAIIFGKRISKNQQKTNWEADSLTTGQQNYAALDARACVEIYEYLKAGKFNPENSIYKKYPEMEESNEYQKL